MPVITSSKILKGKKFLVANDLAFDDVVVSNREFFVF